ncbi:MAG TPA: LysM peptidoglycan-binding domain-containing protein [Ferruginibacter sp.]|nr:LysM peptidoglycan-binding domain-containing protein [Ferruginibacter sp.]HMP20901.1 LysM peptidoglycan-binding domain-containing protein [Ferruginibacter sp.]
MTKKISALLLLLACSMQPVIFAQERLTPEQYIDKYKDIAIREMKRMGVPAAIKLAQGLLETEFGNSPLVKKSNNHFGIKCKSSWSGGGVSHDDDAPGECFRTYTNAEDSYRDHSNYLRGNDRYAFLFELDPADYKAWARGLKKAGYATNPKYPEILIRNIEMYNLQQYSLAALNEVPKFEKNKYKDDKEEKFEYSATEPAAETLYTPVITENTTAINGAKCMYAKAGTSLLAIATHYNIQLSRLLDYNDLTNDGLLKKDQVIYLERKAKKGEQPYYQVQPGETLHDVAQKAGVQLEALEEYNRFSKGVKLQPGAKILLQPYSTPVVEKSTAVTTTPVMYEVQPKDGLYAISRKYGVSVQQLREWNNLSSDTLSIGQKLVVSK